MARGRCCWCQDVICSKNCACYYQHGRNMRNARSRLFLCSCIPFFRPPMAPTHSSLLGIIFTTFNLLLQPRIFRHDMMNMIFGLFMGGRATIEKVGRYGLGPATRDPRHAMPINTTYPTKSNKNRKQQTAKNSKHLLFRVFL